MTRRIVVLLALLALPAHAAAQAEALGDPVPPAPIPIDPEIAELRRDSNEELAHRQREEAWRAREEGATAPRGASIGRTFGGTMAGFGVGSTAGALIGLGVGAIFCGNPFGCPIVSLIAMGISAGTLGTFGAGLGAWALSDVGGGTGNAFAAIGGAFLGAGVAIALGAATWDLNPTFAAAGAPVIGFVLANFGAVLGYQLSQQPERESLAILPLIDAPASGDGIVLGAAGAF